MIKWQLFVSVPAPVKALDHDVFDFAFKYAMGRDVLTFASVFDKPSLDFLLGYQGLGLTAVKIACRPYLYPMITQIPDGLQVFVSIPDPNWRQFIPQMWPVKRFGFLCCVPDYPANQTVYETMFGGTLSGGISDHSPDLRLFGEYEPWVYERHYKLPDSTGLDAGVFASTPEQLKELFRED
jgi:hypothetical protein